LWPTHGYREIIAEMWRVSDAVECLIFASLALMLVYTVFVTARFFRRYFVVRRESRSDFALSSQRNQKNLIAELNRGVGTLKVIASYAPFLGLAGTCYGTLCLFFRGLFSSKVFWVSGISLELSTALIATAAGLIVATPAAISYNVVRACLEKFESKRPNSLPEAMPRSYGFAQTLQLRNRFAGMPAFALIAAPILAILLLMFVLLLRHKTPMGLSVHLLKIDVSDYDSDPIVVRVSHASANRPSEVFVNSQETSWDELGNNLRGQLKFRQHWIVYVAGEDDVPWADVANVIDIAKGLHAEVVLLIPRERIDSIDLPKTNNKIKK
jgi:biopolymer transport protein ExbD